ncbi:Farnesoate epoxidase [Pseudolycoriella hygida]|uniref:Farnesoate epoxidase n=1 Tax=Pseudolycoriella hygida TaxID=35572 RepID=A0A9Q0N657_9DIPT|nr:Farnesoate epoxidase [Pseudolycoriella hygida]
MSSIIWSHGKTWIDVRSYAKKILKEFGYGKVKIMGQSLLDSANQLVDGIKMELLDSTDGFFSVESHKFSIHVMNVLWSLVGGYKFDSNDILLKRNMECVDKAFDIIGHRNLYNMFPFLKNWFPKQVNYPQHLELHREIHDFTKILINDARERRSQRLDSDPISFIEEFLDKIEEHEQDTKTIFTQEQLEIILEDLFFGGLETTGTFLTWSILYLVQNLDVQTKFRKEVLAKMKDRTDLLQTIDLKKIPYVKATVLEILRMGNVVPTPLPRCATQDIEIKEFTIPKGTILFYNLHALYNDKKYWNDPETFMPERFIDEKGEIDAIKSERILSTVFGMGPRVCFGEAVAIDSLFMFLAALILNFKFEIIPGCEPSAKDPVCGLCVCPRKFKVKVSSV